MRLHKPAAVALTAAMALVGTASAAAAPDWGLDRVDQRNLPLDGAFTPASDGAGVNIYVVDTGIRASHQVFGGRVRSAHDATGGTGTEDCYSHGTSVAGIAAKVATKATIQAVRAICDSTDIEGALNWIAKNGVKPAVVNVSLGTPASASIDAATKAVIDAGIPVVVAAGNESKDACSYSPARVPAAITVGASDKKDAGGTFSNKGTCVDILAPGVAIPVATSDSDTSTSVNDGTSEAAPHVAGAVAVYLSTHPKATVTEVWNHLRDSATTGKLTAIGNGTPNRLLYVGK